MSYKRKRRRALRREHRLSIGNGFHWPILILLLILVVIVFVIGVGI